MQQLCMYVMEVKWHSAVVDREVPEESLINTSSVFIAEPNALYNMLHSRPMALPGYKNYFNGPS